MAAFNRGSRSGGGRGFSSKGGPSSGWERRGPVQMHQAVCDKCRQNCEVPFRPTSGKPIFCSNCFEGKRGSESPRTSYGREDRGGDRQMFDATCDECKNRCQVPFQPSGGKPVYCSNCFGEKKNASGERGGDRNGDQFAALNNKLDRILTLLTPAETTVIEEPIEVKKKPSKKK